VQVDYEVEARPAQAPRDPKIVEQAPDAPGPRNYEELVDIRVAAHDRGSVPFDQIRQAGSRKLTLERPQHRRREHDIADETQADEKNVHSIVASSSSITGMSSLIGYTRLHCAHLSAVPFLTSSTFVLQLGQASISSNSGSTGMTTLSRSVRDYTR
jgi:hypothetical protein